MKTSDETLASITNAFLDGDTTVLAALSVGITLPYAIQDVTVTDVTTGQRIGVTAIKNAHTFHATIVGDLQHLLGAPNDWNTDDDHTRLQEINPNLYQYTALLPAGTYHYKIAFNNGWSDVIPYENITLTVPKDNTEVTFSYVPYDNITQHAEIYDTINNPNVALPTVNDTATNLIAITLDSIPDVSHTLELQLSGYAETPIVPRSILDAERFFYAGDDLGYILTPQSTGFRLWAPTAADVQLLLFESETGGISQQVAMHQAENGTWQVSVEQSLENWYYLYLVTVQGKTQTALDPYARALAVNATRAMIVDLAKTQPTNWESDSYQKLANPVDAVIYEVHVRDFSINLNSGMKHKGKFLAFTEHNTSSPDQISTGMESLQELGVTHIQVLPAYEFASVDEQKPDQYNWGYDPRNYNVPEGAYATTPHGPARISEFKQMIQSVHHNQIGVVMDVVYNHTFSTGDSDFDKIVPQYYYRTDALGHYTNGSGCGNEVASERPMVQKFIRDSLVYWVKEYHVDGFRFDLMALLGVDTMQKIEKDLHAIHPGLLIYGEPWIGGSSALSSQQLFTKGQQCNRNLGVFNDHMRNALIGNVFAHDMQGFATGASDQVDEIKQAVTGSVHDFTAAPSETINYASSHDNLTLWDKISASNAQVSEAERIKMDKLVQAILMTSQGVPFFQGGEEFLRTKEGNDNSYNAGDAVNQFDWSRKAKYKDVFEYYAGLIKLRKNHPAFRMTTTAAIDSHLSFLDGPANTVMFQLGPHANQDSWQHILVIYNPTNAAVSFSLPEGIWNLAVSEDQISEQGLQQMTGQIEVPGIACLVLYQN
ncbi:type I pullulanase [Dictyobacter kobayashii]|uniref:Type I pullulanase n=1 Tax=Dictyobacter kobayashii TaxID=2014872 RepID=A0A402AWN3_9CHLR|nr:type I pullulanase [Dictyobacter kobayashii]GCE23496.1 type I pullulanase [Dictyobacter kobayashii]